MSILLLIFLVFLFASIIMAGISAHSARFPLAISIILLGGAVLALAALVGVIH